MSESQDWVEHGVTRDIHEQDESKKYHGEAHFTFDVYGAVGRMLGIPRSEAKRRILETEFGPSAPGNAQ